MTEDSIEGPGDAVGTGLAQGEWCTVELPVEAVGQRLDKVLVDALAGLGWPVTRSRLQSVFAAGDVHIDEQSVPARTKVVGPIVVRVRRPHNEAPAQARAEDIPLDVVFEDEHLMVVNKAAGMVVHAGAGHDSGTLVNAVLHHWQVSAAELPVVPGNTDERPGIVHRLDRETSGVMVVARTELALNGLSALFRSHDLERAYLAVAYGYPSWPSKRVETLHARDPKHRRRFSPDVSRGRSAVSEFRVLDRGPQSCLLRVELETGRTHQIRMHARFLGHPLVCDELYGPAPRRRSEGYRRLSEVIGRQALHAGVLGFVHPVTRESLTFRVAPPLEMQALLGAAGLSLPAEKTGGEKDDRRHAR